MHARTIQPLFTVVTATLIACTHSMPRSAPVSSPVTARVTPYPTHASWHPTRQASQLRYVLRDSSILSISTDTMSKQISFITAAVLQIQILATGNSLTFMGHLDSLTMHSDLEKSTSNYPLPGISGLISPRGVVTEVQPDTITSCKVGIEPAAVRIAELLLETPEDVSVGSQWTDTSTTVVCHGKTALTQRAVYSYHVTTDTMWQTHQALRIERSTVLKVSAFEPDSTNRTFAAGNGSSVSVLLMDPSTGALFESSSRSTVSLSISTERGVFPFQQLSYTYIRRQ